MKEIKLFIDTADESYIKNIWDNFLSNGLTGKEIVGITTNPNAMSKCNVHTLAEFESKTRTLCKLISEIRKDDKGVVYVQHPDSNVSCENLDKWISTILKFSDGQTKIGLKIPPYQKLLEKIEQYRNIIDFNVTGVADCSTALYSFTYSPRYVSLIPGRMEEVGINASEHMRFIDQRKEKIKSELITGSMRTIEGLLSAIKHNTVPTVGSRVFDLLIKHDINLFIKLWDFEDPIDYIKFSPYIDSRSIDLSVAFFNQMDQMGSQLNCNLK